MKTFTLFASPRCFHEPPFSCFCLVCVVFSLFFLYSSSHWCFIVWLSLFSCYFLGGVRTPLKEEETKQPAFQSIYNKEGCGCSTLTYDVLRTYPAKTKKSERD
jgi:hypothetical protein